MLERWQESFSVPVGDQPPSLSKGISPTQQSRVLSYDPVQTDLTSLENSEIQIFTWTFKNTSNESKWTKLREPQKRRPWAALGFWVATYKLWPRQFCPRKYSVGCKSRASRYQGKVLAISPSVCKDHDYSTEAEAKGRSVSALWEKKKSIGALRLL